MIWVQAGNVFAASTIHGFRQPAPETAGFAFTGSVAYGDAMNRQHSSQTPLAFALGGARPVRC